MALADIYTIIVVIMENRAFDHMLGYLSLPGPGQMPVEGLRADPAWTDAHANLFNGAPYPSHRLAPAVQTIVDPNHNWDGVGVQIATPAKGGGLMGGFVESYATFSKPAPDLGNLAPVMGYYDAEALPTYDFFARNFLVCDHWFSALPAGTQPNRLMAMSGYSGVFENGASRLPHQDLVYDWLSRNQVSWCVYQWGPFPFFILDWDRIPGIVGSLTLAPASGAFRRYEHFAASWASAEAMPQVIFIEPEYSEGPIQSPNDDHSPTGVAPGQAFLAQVYADIVANPTRWARTMMIVTYDEHGGFFDHVEPLPIAANAGGHPFATSGLRVPGFVISPQVEAGRVFNRNLDHTSILELLAEKFTRGHGYSDAVNARQGFVDRLSNTLEAAAPPARRPTMSTALHASLASAAAAAPAPRPQGASRSHPANARAFFQAARKIQRDHPQALARPEWKPVRDYLAARP